ncbi:dehydrodolichyl diphosphate syntase complex subunit DHDDS-like protein [Leptotrombidium deliense]|uniref:ditrans,polycis-polyprenyl diphosphate synthase [(2E,6E)-farnesyldiphosphate specific] n=1 Tax=Leptotrombidium deliense TaxID=299467 RepID=A0A443SED8_9ACAR|nr:dehydrodolichyl diphosphate syntase complex subunit DHDDS-like protein [Leptotrombidium deliense]
MSETKLSFLQSFAINVLIRGDIPRHIAFIMDGNRRYADKNHLLKSVGHTHGFNKLMETFEWCKHFGVSEVTVYAFSIENFNRSEEEVNALMTLAREKFNELLSKK